jgi:hypothetical protein
MADRAVPFDSSEYQNSLNNERIISNDARELRRYESGS